MKKEEFLKKLKRIWQKEGLKDDDRRLLKRYFADKKKEVVVTTMRLKDGKKAFFKALKPGASAKTFADFKRGATVSKILGSAKVKTVPQIIAGSVLDKDQSLIKVSPLFWGLFELLPIEDTLLDEQVPKLTVNDAERITVAIFDLQAEFQKYTLENKDYLTHLAPVSRFLDQISFWGEILFFESYLQKRRFLEKSTNEIAYTDQFVNFKKPFLIHGDLAPHNILLGKKLYFIDWERSFITFNQTFGPFYDLANLYIYTWQNPKFQEALRKTVVNKRNTFFKKTSLPAKLTAVNFNFCVYYHLLYKSTYIFYFGLEKKNKKFVSWMREKLASF